MHESAREPAQVGIPVIFLIAEEFGLPETALRNALETGHYRNKVLSDFIGRGDTARRRVRFVAGIQARLAADSSA
jgi:hypothetical protein